MKAKTLHSIVWFLAVLLFFPLLALAQQAPIQVKYAHIGPPTLEEPMHAAATAFKYMLEQESAAKFKVDIFPAGTLGRELDLMEAVRSGVIQVLAASMGGLHRIYPPAILAFAPYVFRNEAVAVEVMEGPFGQKILDDFTSKTGIKALAFNDIYTFLGFSNNVRPIQSPEDMKGLKFRAMDTLQVAMLRALGASAVTIAFSEIYTGLQTGVVDGQTNPGFLLSKMKWDEVQKYFTVSRSQYGHQWIICNKAWYDRLAPKDRLDLYAAVRAAVVANRGTGILQEAQSIANMKAKGLTVTLLTDDQFQKFSELARPESLKWLRTQMDPQWVDDLLKAVEDAEKKLGYR